MIHRNVYNWNSIRKNRGNLFEIITREYSQQK